MSTVVEPSSVGILLVDEAQSRVRSVCRILGRAGFRTTVAGSIAEAMDLLGDSPQPFHAAVLRHRLPDGVSLPLVEIFSRAEPACSCLVLTGPKDQAAVPHYRSRGAFRCVQTPVSDPQLLAHVHATVVDSHRWRLATSECPPPDVPPVVIVDFEAAAERLRYLADLSPAERDVAYWILQGLRDLQIARLLGRAERTAKRHVGQVLSKIGVSNRTSLWAVLRNDSELQIAYGIAEHDDEPEVDPDDEPEDEPEDDPDPEDDPEPLAGSEILLDPAPHP